MAAIPFLASTTERVAKSLPATRSWPGPWLGRSLAAFRSGMRSERRRMTVVDMCGLTVARPSGRAKSERRCSE